MRPENFIWAEKYRPRTVKECVLPLRLQKTFSKILQEGEVPNMLFSGPSGTGKTTVAAAIAQDMGFDFIYINASKDNGIDVLRTKIQDFASVLSLENAKRLVILDEADGVSQQFQRAFRAFVEEFSVSCRFILTCNYTNLIIPALQSRLDVIDFSVQANEKKEVGRQLMKRLREILTEEKISFDNDVLKNLIVKYFPDYRKIISELQGNSFDGELQISALSTTTDVLISELLNILKEKNFMEMRRWVGRNSDIDLVELQHNFYQLVDNHLDQACIPEFILLCADYQAKKPLMVDMEIHTAAFLTELMKLNWLNSS